MNQVTSDTAAADPIATARPFQIRGRFFTAVALRLAEEPGQDFFDALDAELMRMPHFFDHAPFVLDLEQVRDLDTAALDDLVAALKRRNLSVFGVQNGSDQQTDRAKAAGLLSLPSGRDAPLDRVELQPRRSRPEPVPATPPAPKPSSRVITEPVRSGQKLFADRGDLVVLASVGSGAELVAAGNIHVYGALRGRALAGVNGDENARIFCQSLEAELLAVAGLYLTRDDLPEALMKRAAQAYLQDDKLRVDAL